MKITYSPQLMEEATFRHLNHLERCGMRAEYDEFHSLADPIYELPEDDREIAFEKVNRIFFLEQLKLGDFVVRALEACGLIPKKKRSMKAAPVEEKVEASVSSDDASEEMGVGDAPIIEAIEQVQGEESKDEGDLEYELSRKFEEKIKEVSVKRAINKVDEGSNVLNRVSGLPIIELRVLASRFADSDESKDLEAFLIHEFMHAKDMVDPEFDYEDSYIPGNPSVKNLITARFKLLWNIYVDSRLDRRNLPGIMSREARYREFDNYYRKIPERQRRGIFQGVWETEKFSHEELLSMATDLETLMAKYVEYDEDFTEEDQSYIHLPGSPCPLCKFPTYNWVDDPESVCDEMVIEAIQIDFPDWENRDGACDRCIEVYELRAGVG